MTPLGRVLTAGGARLRVHDEEVPRSGLSVTCSYRHGRAVDGRHHVWIGRRVATGGGEARSGLRFDTVRATGRDDVAAGDGGRVPPGRGDSSAPFEVITVDGVREGWTGVAVGRDPGRRRAVLAAMQTTNGGEPCAVRVRNVSAGAFEARIEELRHDDRHPGAEDVGFLVFAVGPIHDRDGRLVGRADVIDVAQPDPERWHRLRSHDALGDDLVILAQVASAHGRQPVHVRLHHDLGGDRGLKLEEWPGQDRLHTEEQVAYAVLRRGVHEMGAGALLEAGTVDGVDDGWTEGVELAAQFGRRPVVLTLCQTFNGADPVVTRQRPAAQGRFDVRLQEGPSGGRHTQEVVGYVAVGAADT